MDKFLKNNMLTYGILGILGICMVLSPSKMLNSIVRLAGLGLLIAGGMQILSYKQDLRVNKPRLDLMTGIVMVVLGLWMLVNTRGVQTLLPTVLGLAILVYGVSGILKGYMTGKEQKTMVTSGIAAVLGLIIASNPFSTMKIFSVAAGVALIYVAVTGFCGTKWMSE